MICGMADVRRAMRLVIFDMGYLFEGSVICGMSYVACGTIVTFDI